MSNSIPVQGKVASRQAPFSPELRSLAFRGHRIVFVDEQSAEENPPILFLHNGGTSHAIWLPVMAELSRNHRVVAIDLLGYGGSDHPGQGYTMELYVDLVAHVLDTLGLENPVLAGNCMGSAISLNFALCHPEKVRAMVIINPLTRATLEAGALGGFARFHRRASALAEPIYKVASSFRLPRWSAGPTLSMQLWRSGRSQGLQKNHALVACHSSKGQLRSMIGVLEDIDAYAALDSFEKPEKFPPMMVIWGGENQILPWRMAEGLNSALRPEREEVVAQGGHLLMMEEPEKVSELISSFLQEL